MAGSHMQIASQISCCWHATALHGANAVWLAAQVMGVLLCRHMIALGERFEEGRRMLGSDVAHCLVTAAIEDCKNRGTCHPTVVSSPSI